MNELVVKEKISKIIDDWTASGLLDNSIPFTKMLDIYSYVLSKVNTEDVLDVLYIIEHVFDNNMEHFGKAMTYFSGHIEVLSMVFVFIDEEIATNPAIDSDGHFRVPMSEVKRLQTYSDATFTHPYTGEVVPDYADRMHLVAIPHENINKPLRKIQTI